MFNGASHQYCHLRAPAAYVIGTGSHFALSGVLSDVNSLTRRWPLALLTIAGTLVIAIIALFLMGG